MISNPGYYESLKNTKLKYPHPGPIEFEKDLRRSAAGLSEENINSMRNVLSAFIIRNPTVGYC
jgi:TBC1 domain family member 8/9